MNKRLAASCRRFKFEAVKLLGFFWLIEKIPCLGLEIKEPWNKLYQRTKR